MCCHGIELQLPSRVVAAAGVSSTVSPVVGGIVKVLIPRGVARKGCAWCKRACQLACLRVEIERGDTGCRRQHIRSGVGINIGDIVCTVGEARDSSGCECSIAGAILLVASIGTVQPEAT